jgi:Holliday junction resolvase-like predicted endonuclease
VTPDLGRLAEDRAAGFLEGLGYKILERRWRCPLGELDLVAEREGLLAFIEVKARPSLAEAAHALGPRQRARLLAAAECWLAANPGHGQAGMRFDLLLVAADFTVRRDLDEERIFHAPLYQFSTTNMYASCFAGVMLGIARRMLDEFKLLAGSKVPSSTANVMRNSPVTQLFVAQQEAKLRQARAYLLEELRSCWDSVQGGGGLSQEQKVLIRLAATSAIHRAREVAESCYHEAGTTAIFEANPFERPCRDIHAAGQQVQARTAHLEAVGAFLLGLEPNQRFI